jgi:hypothetical protein
MHPHFGMGMVALIEVGSPTPTSRRRRGGATTCVASPSAASPTLAQVREWSGDLQLASSGLRGPPRPAALHEPQAAARLASLSSPSPRSSPAPRPEREPAGTRRARPRVPSQEPCRDLSARPRRRRA